jgi:uncharacterized membrane protein
MRKRVIIAGIIILVIGVVLLGGGLVAALSSTSVVNNFNQLNPGEYVSNEIFINTTSTVVVTSPAIVGGLIPSQDLGAVNSANVGTYVIPFNSTTIGDNVYDRLVGSYYYIVFSSTQPATQIVVAGGFLGTGLLTLAGIALIIVGIIVMVVGAIMKNRPKEVKT